MYIVLDDPYCRVFWLIVSISAKGLDHGSLMDELKSHCLNSKLNRKTIEVVNIEKVKKYFDHYAEIVRLIDV